ncbi:PREDICTED: uncharacterized protein LOC105617841 [Atta cephalotes]|uniref:Uncharacterized protein n=1 Tax=Atta cephalotes TaxID=12957 RepID=A0A158NB74_ATTCE|nr:PREDICTED: uncharacterized protein LOC105617841 [Atta cephalotes]
MLDNTGYQLQCCGIDGPSDYRSVESIPWSCCNTTNQENNTGGACTTINKRGCQHVVLNRTRSILLHVFLLALCSVLLQISFIACTTCYIRIYKDRMERRASEMAMRTSLQDTRETDTKNNLLIPQRRSENRARSEERNKNNGYANTYVYSALVRVKTGRTPLPSVVGNSTIPRLIVDSPISRSRLLHHEAVFTPIHRFTTTSKVSTKQHLKGFDLTNQRFPLEYPFESLTGRFLIAGWTIFKDGQYAASISIEKKNTAFGSIPKKLNMNDNNYILAGVVSYHQYASDKNNGHYTAFVYGSLLCGLAILIIGVLVQVGKQNYFEPLEDITSNLTLPAITLIVIGSIIFIIAFLGCCGAIRESHCMVVTFACLLLTILIIQVAISIFVFVVVKNSGEIDFRKIYTENVFMKYGTSQEQRNFVNTIQEGHAILLEPHVINIHIIHFRPQKVAYHRSVALVVDSYGNARFVLEEVQTDDSTRPKSTLNSDFLGMHMELVYLAWIGVVSNSTILLVHISKNEPHR